MNLTWHIVKKDLRRLRWPLVGWGALMLVRIGLGLRLKYGDPPDPILVERLQNFNNLFLAFQLVVAYVLVSVLVHEEPLLGTGASWRVRPISGGRLLRAKLLGLAVLGLVPEVVSLPWWLTNGFSLRDLAWASLETVGLHAVVILAALLVAVLTDGLPRFLAWTLVLITAVGTMLSIVLAANQASEVKIPARVIETRFVVGLAVAVIGIAAVVVRQFLTRRPARAFATAGVTAVLVVGISLRWPWDWSSAAWSHAIQPQPAPTKLIDAVSFTLEKARLMPPTAAQPDRTVELDLSAHGLSSDLLLDGGEARCTWRWSDGTTELANGYFYSPSPWLDASVDRVLGLPPPRPDPETHKWFEERRQARGISIAQNNWLGFRINVRLSTAVVGRMRDNPPTCLITVPVHPWRMAANETSLRPGAVWSLLANWRLAKAERCEEVRANWEGVMHCLNVTIVEIGPALSTDCLGFLPVPFTEIRGNAASYFLIDRPRGRSNGDWRRAATPARIVGVTIRWLRTSFVLPRVVRQGKWTDAYSPDWFDQTTLARVELREAGWFKREIKVDRFELQDEPAPPPLFEP